MPSSRKIFQFFCPSLNSIINFQTQNRHRFPLKKLKFELELSVFFSKHIITDFRRNYLLT